MSRSAKDKQSSGRRQNEENEPFLVEEIPGSPKIRGRRQTSQEESPFVIENIPRSPVSRGRRINSEEDNLLVEEMSGSPVMRGRGPRATTADGRSTLDSVDSRETPIWTSNSDAIARSATIPTAPTILDPPPNTRRNEPPAHEDAPPSYESSIPPSHIGWAMDFTNPVPFPMPQLNPNSDIKMPFNSRPNCPYPLMELSPLPKSYLSLDRPSSRSSGPSPSQSPSPNRLRPAYTQHTTSAYVSRQGARPQYRYRSEFENERLEMDRLKQNDRYAYRHGGLVMAIFFVIFMTVLALIVTFLVRRNSHRR